MKAIQVLFIFEPSCTWAATVLDCPIIQWEMFGFFLYVRKETLIYRCKFEKALLNFIVGILEAGDMFDLHWFTSVFHFYVSFITCILTANIHYYCNSITKTWNLTSDILLIMCSLGTRPKWSFHWKAKNYVPVYCDSKLRLLGGVVGEKFCTRGWLGIEQTAQIFTQLVNAPTSYLSRSLQGLSTVKGVDCSSQFGATCKLNLSSAPKSLMNTLKRTGPKIEPCKMPLLTGHQAGVAPFTVAPMSLTCQAYCSPIHLIMAVSSCTLGIWSRNSTESFTDMQKDDTNWVPQCLHKTRFPRVLRHWFPEQPHVSSPCI